MANKQRVIFLDRDGTILIEPEDWQIDALDKFQFMKDAIFYLSKISRELDYQLVLITNQDGLGTDAHPEDKFWPYQNLMVDILKANGVEFVDTFIDKSYAKDNLPTRKPNTGLLTKYIEGNYNLKKSFVIGDRLTDIQLAKNLKAKGILIGKSTDESDDDTINRATLEKTLVLETNDWKSIYNHLRFAERKIQVKRKTSETKINIKLNLDGQGKYTIDTGLNFFDHMLEQLSRHSGVDMKIKVKGDLHIDEHHTIEDTALALGKAFRLALGNKLGIERYGFLLPMDDALAQVAIDFGGRPWLVYDVEFKREKIGDMPTEMFEHFFKSFSDASMSNINISAEGNNEHHKIESIFKALAKAIKMALRRGNSNQLPSTKGAL